MELYVFFRISHFSQKLAFFAHLKTEAFLKGYCLTCRLKLGHETAQVGTIQCIEDC